MLSVLHTPTHQLEESISFYQNLGFKKIPTDGQTIMTDGKAIIEINPDRYARAGIKLYKEEWLKEVEILKETTAVHSIRDGFLLSDVNGVWIYLIEKSFHLDLEPVDESFSVLGNFSGVSIETTDLERSEFVWKNLGSVMSGSPDQGWVSFKLEDGLSINIMKPLMCPHLFFNPSMTYFNGKEGNPKVIQEIRNKGIPITEEITHFNNEGKVDNIIIRDPGGYGFFIFND